jgi:hypothetical protein
MTGADDRGDDLEFGGVPRPEDHDHARSQPQTSQGMRYTPSFRQDIVGQAERQCEMQAAVVTGM